MADIESHKDLSPLQTLVNGSCTGTDPDAENSAKIGGGARPKSNDSLPLIEEIHSLIQQGDRAGAASKAGTLVKAIGISHSGAAQYQIGSDDGVSPCVIARTPFDSDCFSKNPALKKAMDNYLGLLHLEPSPDTYEKVSAAGDVCLSLASSWSALLLSLRQYREHLHESHFQGLFDIAIDELTPHAGLLQSARKIAQAGVDARTEVVFPRVHAKNHTSAKDHVEQALAEIWKDAQKMRVFFCTSKSEALLDGTVSVPLGWVPKTFPDRTVSQHEGRLVHDPKLLNDISPKHKFFPALMPLHSELARILLSLYSSVRFHEQYSASCLH